ncbi:M50 family metallopeptidase [Pseudonocardia petroleophila]|uniref:M50 family metallopeptidase n=1 Tax=Pseudonocardia petroleophila TaxID=37331 RepID=A0A7G7MKZ7_9PSEU|nr:M50 family metallopeptidase [Pseudonocardia petroleophila]QNG53458.1 M50 family metallopeptidase [Pseudonocardia petroleophila]
MIGPVTAGSTVVHVAGFVALLLVVFTGSWAASIATVAHEGGHVVVALLSGRNPRGFKVNEGDGGGGETVFDAGWGVSLIFIGLAGYLTPPLLGLAGANLVLAGKSWSVLWVSVLLLIGSFLHARGLFTNLVVVLAGAGIGWVAATGSDDLQALVAVTLVWLMLFGGIRALLGQGLGVSGSDAAQLSRFTWIPAILWVALFCSSRSSASGSAVGASSVSDQRATKRVTSVP